MADENYFAQYDTAPAETGVPKEQALGIIRRNESGGQNIFSNVDVPGYTREQRGSGYYQIIPSTWREGARLAGVDTSQYPLAIDAPYEVQTQVAGALYDKYGMQPWSKNQNAMAQLRGPQNYFSRFDAMPEPNYFSRYDTPSPTDQRQRDLQMLDQQPNEHLGREGWKQLPMAQTEQLPPEDTWWSALTGGLGSAVRGGQQTYQAITSGRPVASEPTTAAAQPIQWSDIWSPGLLGRKFVYGLAASAPEIVGFGAGAAVAGGPETPAGLLAGATGAAIAHAATSLGPTFGQELKATPDDPHAAFERAMEKTGVGSLFTGAGFAAFGIAPFQSALKNLMFQAFGVQPGLAMAEKAATNVVEGKPAGENITEGVPGAVLMTAAPLAAHEAARHLTGREAASTATLEKTAEAQPAPEAVPALQAEAARAAGRSEPAISRETSAEPMTPEQTAILEREEAAKAAAAGLSPVYDDKGNWIGYERREATPEAGVAEPAKPVEELAAETPTPRDTIPTNADITPTKVRQTAATPIESMVGEPAPPEGQGSLYSFPGALFDPEAWRRWLGTPPVGDEFLRDKRGIDRAVGEVKSWFAPTSLRGASEMEQLARRHGAELAQSTAQAEHTLSQVRDVIDRLPAAGQEEMTWRMETGQGQLAPPIQQVADTLRGLITDWTKKVQSLGRGYLENAIDDYMGHIWGNYREWKAGLPAPTEAEMAEQAAMAGAARRPLRGSGAFLKLRSFPTQRAGIEAGLVPLTMNPIDMQLLKLREMQRFYHGTRLADQMKEAGIAQWVPQSKTRGAEAEGLVRLDDRVFQPRLYNVSPIGPVEPGNWYAPEPAARIFNRYMSRGIYGNSIIYDTFRAAGNALNTLQLGISGFHAMFVTLDTAMSRVALGLQQAMGEGRPVRGASTAIFGAPLTTIFQTARRGSMLKQAWLDPEHATPEWRDLAEDLNRAGGRISMDKFYRSSASGPFFRSIADLKNPMSVYHQAAQMLRDAPTPLAKYMGVPLRLAARTLDTIQEPLMGALVPRAKLGVFSDLARNWNEQHPNATEAERSAAMIKFWDSVDNRLGEMVYDNVFWHKALKDMAFVSVRSVGWNLGTVRELAGGVVDSGKFLKDLVRMQPPQFTTRMAYSMAMPAVTMLYGAVLTYLATGKSPQSLMDYFFPPTGGQTDTGEVERRSMPGYMKDVIAFGHAPWQTVLNKLHPLLETLTELHRNADYYGGSIYDPERDIGRVPAYANYLLNQVLPFSWRGYSKLHEQSAPMLDQALAFFGVQPAPKSITQPEKEEAYQARQAKMSYRHRLKETGRIEFFPQTAPQPAGP